MKLKFLAIIFGLFAISLSAQDGPSDKGQKERAKRMEAQKIAFLTNKLELSPEEASKFWPVFNEYSAKQKALRGDREKRPSREDWENMSDADADKLLNQMLQKRENELNLQKSYISKFKAVLPTKKVVKLFHLEKKFKEEMLRTLKHRLHEKENRKGGERETPSKN